MLTLIVRAIIVYLLVLVVFRLMGKRQIGEMQPFELVLTLVIADLATIPMAESAIPTLDGVVPLITLVVVHFALSFISKKSQGFRKVLNGKPVIVINPDGIDFAAIETLNMTVDDIFEAIRSAGYFKLEEIQYAIMETNGVVNVLPKSEFAPATNGDLKIKTEKSTIPYTIISEGKVLDENLLLLKYTKKELDSLLKKRQIKGVENIGVFTIDKNGQCYLQEKNKPFQLFSVNLKVVENE
ncbi:MAG: DUF421 domain-containing protein [Clostridia bacterium]|nr:DUF421 domain-containing protein [Clostridia bacterium]